MSPFPQLHFLLAVYTYHSQLTRYNYHHLYPHSPYYSHSHSHSYSHPFRRILLVPTSSHDLDSSVVNTAATNARDVEMVYAPVPRDSLPKELQEQATEAWVSTSSSNHYHHHHGHHRHSRHHRHRSSSKERTGRIRLDISPGEGLLPPYKSQGFTNG